MKLRLSPLISNDNELISNLQDIGIEITDDAKFTIIPSQQNDYIKCRRNGENTHPLIDDIIFVESFAHDVIIYASNGKFSTSLRIKQLANLLPNDRFIQISQSAVVSIAHIQKIRAALNAKYYITMSNGDKLTVTRSYYRKFKLLFGI